MEKDDLKRVREIIDDCRHYIIINNFKRVNYCIQLLDKYFKALEK